MGFDGTITFPSSVIYFRFLVIMLWLNFQFSMALYNTSNVIIIIVFLPMLVNDLPTCFVLCYYIYLFQSFCYCCFFHVYNTTLSMFCCL